MKTQSVKNRSMGAVATILLTALLCNGASAGVIRGPLTLGPDSRLKLDCPEVPTASNMVRRFVQGFGAVSSPVRFKLTYRPDLYSSPQDVNGTNQITSDYNQTLSASQGNFPGPGYYSLVVRNTNSYSITIPAGQSLGILCQ